VTFGFSRALVAAASGDDDAAARTSLVRSARRASEATAARVPEKAGS
jgi:hypothetical protein